ncbi:MAG: GNAT family protein [Acidimicrobiia bacterium]
MQIPLFELAGAVVRLAPMALDHVDGLVAAATEDRATYGFTAVPADAATMTAYVTEMIGARERGHDIPFTTCAAASGRVIGSTRFLVLRSYFGRGVPDAVEIGGTWLAASAQRTAANTEAKLLMLRHAFDEWGVQRVDLKTDARNAQSRAAIERIGARLDGVMRNWQPSLVPGEHGLTRDSAMYSIVPSEWPAVRRRLLATTAAD